MSIKIEQSESLVVRASFNSKSEAQQIVRTLTYDRMLCCGEVVRNICVNIGVDPDTTEGVTQNISIRRNGVYWCYDPQESLMKAGVCTGDTFVVELI